VREGKSIKEGSKGTTTFAIFNPKMALFSGNFAPMASIGGGIRDLRSCK
jgi:hypothetical protein